MSRKDMTMAKQSSSDLRNIEIARLAYTGAAIAAVADAIALLGDGISAYAAKLTLDAFAGSGG